ncbi:DUF2306 domain-containing protein [Xanthovirga aplysinae]|uniref:DUF2306 domain-containing protein n=1 Tax=Xanthovirga aplysinae TaxID=2529853 RepID=UPI0012BB7501|nr:DUF2306 domain-containing protein [Xanthovirga aplysinae]MTI29950.1 DUF2306 domain-containing protein [Xanthovirga aplysinae]
MENIISSPVGLIHTIFALISVLTGTIVIVTIKGTKFHKIIGYTYVISMLIMNGTAFGIFRLFGGFGVFHVFALLSLFALFGGMYPVLNRKKVADWYIQHLKVMSWSVVGLYAALAAEIGVRFFEKELFFWIVGVSGGLITTIGAILINRRKKLERTRMKATTKNV